jgi:hypothetical protein
MAESVKMAKLSLESESENRRQPGNSENGGKENINGVGRRGWKSRERRLSTWWRDRHLPAPQISKYQRKRRQIICGINEKPYLASKTVGENISAKESEIMKWQ